MRSLPAPESGTPDQRSAARYLLWLATRTWPTLIGAIACGIVWMVSQAPMPAVIGKAIDAGVTARDLGALGRWGALLFVLGVLQAVAGVFRHRLAAYNWLSAAYRTIQLTVDQAGRLGATLPKPPGFTRHGPVRSPSAVRRCPSSPRTSCAAGWRW